MKYLLPIALLALASNGLFAEKLEVTGGVQTGLTCPMGDFNNKHALGTNTSFSGHVGGHLGLHFDRHHQLRPHLTFSRINGSKWNNTIGNTTNNFEMMQLGADWVYSLDRCNRGLYTVLGLSFTQIKREQENVIGPITTTNTHTQNGKLALRGGLGYSFNSLFALEGSVNQAQVNSDGDNGFGFSTPTWAQVSAVFRFGGR